MTVKQFASVARGDDVEYSVTCNGNAYTFDPDDAFMICAYGDFEVARVDLSTMNRENTPVVHVELELNAHLVKEVLA